MTAGEYQHIRFEVERNGVATIAFNLPTMANAMDLLGVQETLDALRQCEKRSDIGAVVLIGAAIVASLMPAARASRVDVVQALRAE